VALKQLRNGKAVGISGILAEMLKVGRTNLDFVTMLVCAIWRERQVPQDW